VPLAQPVERGGRTTLSAIPIKEYRERRALVRDSLQAWEIDIYLVTTPSDLRYLTGFDGIAPLGPNPFTGGPSAALLLTRDGAIMSLPQPDAGLLPDDRDLEVDAYPTFLELSPLYPRRLFRDALAALVERAGAGAARVGYQAESLPAALLMEISERSPAHEPRELSDAVGLLRMRKSDAEIAALRRSIAACDEAQATVRANAAPGTSEMAILDEIRATIQSLAGQSVPLIHEVTSGPRSGRIGFSASGRELSEGDLLLTDIAPQIDGYWGDSCATLPIGTVSENQMAMLRTVKEALIEGTEAVHPGMRASELDAVMREHVGQVFPAYHNSGGHGIGLDYHEPPRLVPGEPLPLEQSMVLAMEPGIYVPDVAGVRLEHVVLVTADGCEVLSRHLDA
jgi:Xaa-Pro aminopeptidase